MKPSIIKVTMSHSLDGVSDSFFRPRDEEVLEEYLKAVDSLTISSENNRNGGSKQRMKTQGAADMKEKLERKDDRVRVMREQRGTLLPILAVEDSREQQEKLKQQKG